MNQPVGDLRIFSLVGFFEFVNSFEALHNGHLWDKKGFLCREVVVVGAREGDTHDTTGHDTSLVSPSRAPILFFAHYFQVPTTQAMVVSESPTGLSCSNNG